MTTVRVATFAGPGAPPLIRKVPRPKVPAKAALIQIGACGVCGTDLHILRAHEWKPRYQMQGVRRHREGRAMRTVKSTILLRGAWLIGPGPAASGLFRARPGGQVVEHEGHHPASEGAWASAIGTGPAQRGSVSGTHSRFYS